MPCQVELNLLQDKTMYLEIGGRAHLVSHFGGKYFQLTFVLQEPS